MKKVMLALSLGVASLAMVGCSNVNYNHRIIRMSENILGIRIKGDYKIESVYDTHGGFHNDGHSVDKVIFSDEGLDASLKVNDRWDEAPLTSNIETIIYGDKDDSYSGRIFEYNNEAVVPTIEDGYYLLFNKFTKEYDNDNRYENLPSNFILALYDNKTKTLYICEFDS